MKRIVIYFTLFCTGFIYSQKDLKYGTYKSKEGSILILGKDNSYSYTRSNDKIVSDVIALDFKYDSFGKFKVKNGFIFFTSDKIKIENNIYNKDRGIKLNITRKKIDFNPKLKYINVDLDFDDELLSVYLCNTFNERTKDMQDCSNCYKLSKKNKVKNFTKNYFLRIYPNIQSYKLRCTGIINTLFFDTKKMDKNFLEDLKIHLEFDIRNFDLISFNKEIMLIKKGKIYHEGQVLSLEENPK